MKPTLIVLIVGILAVGCLTSEQKQKALRDSVVGEYKIKRKDGVTDKAVFLDNGIYEYYANGNKIGEESKWSISNGEIHIKREKCFLNIRASITVYRINPDKSITDIAGIRDGEREDMPKEIQWTYKKIK